MGNKLIICRSKYVVQIKCPGRKIVISLSLLYGYIDITIVLVFPLRIFSNFDFWEQNKNGQNKEILLNLIHKMLLEKKIATYLKADKNVLSR